MMLDPTLHTGNSLDVLLNEYLDDASRNVLLIAGGGFDPRASSVARRIGLMRRPQKRGLFIREERAGATNRLRRMADANTDALVRSVPSSAVEEIQIFAEGNAVIGGREIAKLLSAQNYDEITDIVLDISALSTGVYFPATKVLLEEAKRRIGCSLHLIVDEQPKTDHAIVGVASDRATFVHGFRGGFGLDENAKHARLWLPQLTPGRRQTFERMYSLIGPDDVCPILPFPCGEPRLPDILVQEYREMLQSWSVDFRNIVHASESDPLDLHRTILRLVDSRDRVFAAAGGSIVMLSPTGTKVLSVGALLAALEKDLPVVLVESVSYEISFGPETLSRSVLQERLVHLWLHDGNQNGADTKSRESLALAGD